VPEPEYFIRQGDSGLVIRTVCRDAAGAAVNIAGATVEFHMAPINGSGTPVIDASATNENSTATGQVSYTFASAVNTAGLYLGEFEITFGGGAIQTFPNGDYILIYVSPAVA
jgi:hypothetical protein